ncbi:MAG: TIGR02677 family protein [Actinomycetota bacterium]|nr:TIGR02677 family protein [Actinomycetota bacterium]
MDTDLGGATPPTREEATPNDVVADGSPYRVFAYVLAERAGLYVDVVDALVAAKDRFRLQLRPADVARELAAAGRARPEDEVLSALEALAEWGNVSRFYDSAAPETLSEFYGKRFLYQLTPEGVAAHEGIEAARRAGLASGGRLSAVLLPGVIERLEAVRAEVADPDPARLYALLIDLFSTFGELAENAARYMSDLAVETTEVAADHERFVAYKRAVFTYLNTFVARFTELVPRIVELVGELDPAMDDLLALAAAQDAAPNAAGDDRGPLETFRRRWQGVRAWFVSDGEQPPIAELLRVAMLDALNRILVAVTRLNERGLRRASREADFEALARWFAEADDDGARRLWDAAFGTFAARHFTELAGDEDVERRRSFWDAEPAAVAPRLRAAGVRASPGRPGGLADYTAAKAARVAEVRRARARASAAVARLAARTPCRLSGLGAVDEAELEQLLAALTAGLGSRPGADGRRRARTPHGLIALGAPDDGAATASIRTPHGVLHAPDLLLDVEVWAPGRARDGGYAAGEDSEEAAG